MQSYPKILFLTFFLILFTSNFIYLLVLQMIFLITSLLIALTVKDLSVVLSFVGATGSTTVSYILPGVFYYKMFKNEGPKWKRDLSLIQFLTGLVIVPVCLSFIFL